MTAPRFSNCVRCGEPLNRALTHQDRSRIYCTEVCRFEEKIDKTPGFGPKGDCWRWTASTDSNGYGHLTFKKKTVKAHRVSFEVHTGHAPGDLLVIHLCDNRKCVNPDHLALATNAANMHDRNSKERQARGERSGRRVLSDALVQEIRSSPLSGRKLARQLGVSPSSIFAARNGRTWTHVQ